MMEPTSSVSCVSASRSCRDGNKNSRSRKLAESPQGGFGCIFPHFSLSEGRALDYSVYGDAKTYRHLVDQAQHCGRSHDARYLLMPQA